MVSPHIAAAYVKNRGDTNGKANNQEKSHL